MRRDKKIPTLAGKRGMKKGPFLEMRPRADTAGRIITAATRLFADKGYEGTSTKDICETAAVNIAAIHYHFGSKENLLRHIIQQHTSEVLSSSRRTLQTSHSPDDMKVRLEIFLRDTLEAVLRNADVIIIMQREMEMLSSRSDEVFRATLLETFGALVKFLAQAKKKSLIAHDVDPFFAAALLMGHIGNQPRSDRMYSKYFRFSLSDKKFRERWVQQTLRLFLDGILINHP